MWSDEKYCSSQKSIRQWLFSYSLNKTYILTMDMSIILKKSVFHHLTHIWRRLYLESIWSDLSTAFKYTLYLSMTKGFFTVIFFYFWFTYIFLWNSTNSIAESTVESKLKLCCLPTSNIMIFTKLSHISMCCHISALLPIFHGLKKIFPVFS